MNKSARLNYRKSAMIRINQYLTNTGLTGYLGKQNARIKKFAELNGLTIPINKSCIDWAIELYLSKENNNCSQGIAISKEYKKVRIKVKTKRERKAVNRFDDELIECARVIDEALDSKESKYIKLDYAKAYLLFYLGYMDTDLDNLTLHVHTNDLRDFIETNSVVHSKYLKSLKWAQLKDYVRERDNYTCCKCGSNMEGDLKNLHTHHLTYDRLGNENPETDLVLLCADCHNKEHNR